jgi:hypothetical protein
VYYYQYGTYHWKSKRKGNREPHIIVIDCNSYCVLCLTMRSHVSFMHVCNQILLTMHACKPQQIIDQEVFAFDGWRMATEAIAVRERNVYAPCVERFHWLSSVRKIPSIRETVQCVALLERVEDTQHTSSRCPARSSASLFRQGRRGHPVTASDHDRAYRFLRSNVRRLRWSFIHLHMRGRMSTMHNSIAIDHHIPKAL